MVLLLLAFVAGILTALAPCVLPLLPVIIGGTLGGGKKQKNRPYIIAGSLAASLFLFTLLLKATSLFLNVPSHTWTYVSGGIIIVLGLVAVFPALWEAVVIKFNWQASSQRLFGKSTKQTGWLGAVLTGAALGPVFSSCSPTYAFILATVLPRNFVSGLLYMVVYCLGLVAVLLLVSVYGRRFISRFHWAANPHSMFRRLLGLLFIVVGVFIIIGWDKKVELWVDDHIPFSVTNLDQKLVEKNKKSIGADTSVYSTPAQPGTSDPKLFNVRPVAAPELTGLSSWINSSPLTLAGLKGKVVLIDFWTYSCINCVRTLPHVEKWYETYKDKGFVVIGVHAPEFSFEHVAKNVENGVKENNLTYPVALDNDLATWNAFGNQYWPAHYLIDKNGDVRAAHFGEGGYEDTEKAIQILLGESGTPLSEPASDPHQNASTTPETYFGTQRAQNYVGTPQLSATNGTYAAATSLMMNQWSLGGGWLVDQDKVTSQNRAASLDFRVSAKDVYVVASVPDGMPAAKIAITINNSTTYMTVDGSNLYHIAAFGSFQDATLHLTVPVGVSLHTFTFGS